MNFYVSIGDIQDRIDFYNETHDNYPTFLEILQELYQDRKFISSESELPDINGLAMLDDDKFLKKIRTLYFRFPDKVLTQKTGFDIVPVNADLTVISQLSIDTFLKCIHYCYHMRRNAFRSLFTRISRI